MFRPESQLVGLFAVPVFLYMAWRNWISNIGTIVPLWSKAVGSTALLLLSVHWIAIALLEGAVLLNRGIPVSLSLRDGMICLSHPLDVSVIALSVALKATRIETIVASLLMLMCWPLGYV